MKRRKKMGKRQMERLLLQREADMQGREMRRWLNETESGREIKALGNELNALPEEEIRAKCAKLQDIVKHQEWMARLNLAVPISLLQN